MVVKSSTSSGYTRSSYLKFSLSKAGSIATARLRIYGSNTDNTSSINISSYGIDNDSWTEKGITWNNAPAAPTNALSAAGVNNQAKYYEFDVTSYVKTQAAGDKIASLLIKDPSAQNKNLAFNSKENIKNPPQLVIERTQNDITPPAVNIEFNGISYAPGTYKNKVEVVINASDQGGSGLALTEYSLNGAAFQTYSSPIIINTPGNDTIKARATDGNGNITLTNDIAFSVVLVPEPLFDTLAPIADAFIRNGSYAAINYGSDTSLFVKSSTSSGYTRSSYLKFSLSNVSNIASAKLRIYGRNNDNTLITNISCYGVDNDAWSESGITWKNAPAALATALSSADVNDQARYYELDVTNYVKTQFSGDKVVSLLIKDPTNQNRNLAFSSKENRQSQPQLVITTSIDTSKNTALRNNSNTLSLINNSNKPHVYPNPAGKIFNIRFPNPFQGNFSLQIADRFGRIYNIGKSTLPAGVSDLKVDISHLNLKPGVYFLKINSDIGKEKIKPITISLLF